MTEKIIYLLEKVLRNRYYSPWGMVFELGISNQDHSWGANFTITTAPESGEAIIFSGYGDTIESALDMLADKVISDLADRKK